ncbi:MAG TPA: dihydroorotase, partial [Verrucomicrobiota bacterium]|nr:dihydroorotase [Verrucomicrobiota bacterium]
MSSLLLKGGRLIDPANGLDETADLLLADGKVAAIGTDASGQAPEGTSEIDVTGKVVCPGLIDIHVHFREPGQTAKE